MQRVLAWTLVMGAVMSASWAYMVISTLRRELPKEITALDLGVVFILGMICGIFLGIAFFLRWRNPANVK